MKEASAHSTSSAAYGKTPRPVCMRSSSATERDSRTDNIEDNTPPTGVDDDDTPIGVCDDVKLPAFYDIARLAIATDETDAGTLGCTSSPGRLASERTASRCSAVVTMGETTGGLSLIAKA